MEYTVQKLGQLAGVSSRTLRYYDAIGILKPARKSASGYRFYGEKEVGRLQQILFYRELDIPLNLMLTIHGGNSPRCKLQAATLRLVHPDRKGVANATFMTATDLGIGLGALVLGWVFQYTS